MNSKTNHLTLTYEYVTINRDHYSLRQTTLSSILSNFYIKSVLTNEWNFLFED